jgi:hypothetical protein
VTAAAVVRLTVGRLADWRRDPRPFFGQPLKPALIKNADDQTIAALDAVRQALEGSSLSPADLAGWGLVVAPRLPGRPAMRQQLGRFADEGAWGVSPHIIPNCSLHSGAGLLAQVLQLHGPNLGVGGTPGSESGALPVAFGMLSGGRLPGVCVVWSGDPADDAEAQCLAFALALSSEHAGQPGVRLSLLPPDAGPPGGAVAFDLEELVAAWESGFDRERAWSLDGNGWVVLEASDGGDVG